MAHAAYECKQCDAKFFSKEAKNEHRKIAHGVESCTFTWENGITLTMKRPPNQRKVWPCPWCGALFKGTSSRRLKEHWILAGHGKPLEGEASSTGVKSESDSDDDGEPEIVCTGMKSRSEKLEERAIEQALAEDGMDVDVNAAKVPAAEESQNPIQPEIPIHQVDPCPTVASQPIPPALKAFLDSTRVSMYHTADIYVKYQFTSDATLDWAAGIERTDRGFAEIKQELISRGKLIAWFAFDEALNRRAIAKGITVRKITR
ncbi:hypothetical protein PsYK624_055950 [Phanerochaete sordida]|uniref:C2H2-type domain-containing protein n=1 Tax=Phanerochaete sordida TaxID=48140 RepID=A0A9P3G8T5_9APHY|nr:hypothetical protein PsYK624_055950 [Phanerochaete sordida]